MRVIDDDGKRWIIQIAGGEVRVYRNHPGVGTIARCEVDRGVDLSAVAREACELVTVDGKATIVSWERPELEPMNAALRGIGCTLHRRKYFVERDLTVELPEAGTFGWRSLAETGEPEFIRVMTEASDGDPFEEGERDPQAEWDELVEHTASLDPTLWRLALVDGAIAGVVLPTIWPGDAAEGTLSYIGLLPAHRGRGLGRALHAAGLALLAAAGARKYLGSTDDRNAAMARVFEKNGCRVKAMQLLFHPPTSM